MMKQRNAFTLAEVLITLGIIGVVAAMTMPTLLNSTQGAQYRTAYKKALSVLSQAVVLNVALDDYDLSQATATGDTGRGSTAASLYNLFNNRMNVARVCGGGAGTCGNNDSWQNGAGTRNYNSAGSALFGGKGNAASNNYTYFFNDGTTLSFPKNSGNCTEANKCQGIIDVNGAKNPNKLVECDAGTEGTNCKVSNPTDMYPVLLYDQTIVPKTTAANTVLFGGK